MRRFCHLLSLCAAWWLAGRVALPALAQSTGVTPPASAGAALRFPLHGLPVTLRFHTQDGQAYTAAEIISRNPRRTKIDTWTAERSGAAMNYILPDASELLARLQWQNALNDASLLPAAVDSLDADEARDIHNWPKLLALPAGLSALHTQKYWYYQALLQIMAAPTPANAGASDATVTIQSVLTTADAGENVLTYWAKSLRAAAATCQKQGDGAMQGLMDRRAALLEELGAKLKMTPESKGTRFRLSYGGKTVPFTLQSALVALQFLAALSETFALDQEGGARLNRVLDFAAQSRVSLEADFVEQARKIAAIAGKSHSEAMAALWTTTLTQIQAWGLKSFADVTKAQAERLAIQLAKTAEESDPELAGLGPRLAGGVASRLGGALAAVQIADFAFNTSGIYAGCGYAEFSARAAWQFERIEDSAADAARQPRAASEPLAVWAQSVYLATRAKANYHAQYAALLDGARLAKVSANIVNALLHRDSLSDVIDAQTQWAARDSADAAAWLRPLMTAKLIPLYGVQSFADAAPVSLPVSLPAAAPAPSASAASSFSAWMQAGGNGQRLGRGGPGLPSAAVRWKTSVSGAARSDFLPTQGPDGVLFLSVPTQRKDAASGGLYAISPVTGAVLWRWSDAQGIGTPPVVSSDGLIYFCDSKGALVCLNAKTRQPLWRVPGANEKQAGTSSAAPTLTAKGLVLKGSAFAYGRGGRPGQRGGFAAYDAKTGQIVWNVGLKDFNMQETALPGIGLDNVIYVTGHPSPTPDMGDGVEEHIYAVNGSNGKALWQHKIEFKPFVPILVGDDNVAYALTTEPTAGEKSEIIAMEGATGLPRWSRRWDGRLTAGALSAENVLYVGLNMEKGSAILALDAANGKTLWQYQMQRNISEPTLASNGTVYFACDDLRLYALDSKTHQKKWDVLLRDAGKGLIIGVEGTLFALGETGSLYAIGRGESPARTGAASQSVAILQNGKLVTLPLIGGTETAATDAQKQAWRHALKEADRLSPDGKYRVEGENVFESISRVSDGVTILRNEAIANNGDIRNEWKHFGGWLPDSRHFALYGEDASSPAEFHYHAIIDAQTGRPIRFNGWLARDGKHALILSEEGAVDDALGFYEEFDKADGTTNRDYNHVQASRLGYYAAELPGGVDSYHFSTAPRRKLLWNGKPFQFLIGVTEIHFSDNGEWALCEEYGGARKDSVKMGDIPPGVYLISLKTGKARRLAGKQARFVSDGAKR